MKLEKKKAEKDASEKDKEQIEEYNEYIEYLTEVRKTELPPVYEPLRLFCELLFGLADELGLSPDERMDAESILRERDKNGQLMNIFLDCSLDNLYCFDLQGYEFSLDDVDITFDGKKIMIPAQYVSDASVIILSVNGQTIRDWTVKDVARNKSENIEDFIVTFTSKEVGDLKFSNGEVVTIEVLPFDGADNAMVFNLVVEKGFLNITTNFVRR